MLVLTRETGQSFRIGNDIEVTVVKLGRGRVRLGITAPGDVAVQRKELLEQLHEPKTDVVREQPRRGQSERAVPKRILGNLVHA